MMSCVDLKFMHFFCLIPHDPNGDLDQNKTASSVYFLKPKEGNRHLCRCGNKDHVNGASVWDFSLGNTLCCLVQHM